MPSVELSSSATTPPAPMRQPARTTDVMSMPSKEPDAQKRNSLNASRFEDTMAWVTDVSAADTAIPASARRAREPVAPLPDRTNTSSDAAAAPPTDAARLTPLDVTPKVAVVATTAKAAPALIPSTPGSARGLRVIACMTEPARPSAPPPRRAASVRGTRRLTTTCASWLVPPLTRASQTTESAMCREPRASEAATLRTSASVATEAAVATLAAYRILIPG